MQKAHIVISPDPLPSGGTQRALCRAELKNFEWLVQVDPEGWGPKKMQTYINPITTCRICYQQEWPDGYLYLAKSGEVADAGPAEE